MFSKKSSFPQSIPVGEPATPSMCPTRRCVAGQIFRFFNAASTVGDVWRWNTTNQNILTEVEELEGALQSLCWYRLPDARAQYFRFGNIGMQMLNTPKLDRTCYKCKIGLALLSCASLVQQSGCYGSWTEFRSQWQLQREKSEGKTEAVTSILECAGCSVASFSNSYTVPAC